MDNFKNRSPLGGGTSKSFQTAVNNKLKIRDNMDGVLETNGFYRKHVANEPDSIYRTISDVLFDTQFYRYLVKRAHILFQNSEESQSLLKFDDKNSDILKEENQAYSKHDAIRIFAQIFKRPIEMVYTSGPSVKILKFYPSSKKLWQQNVAITDYENNAEPKDEVKSFNKLEKVDDKQAKPKYVMQAAVSNETPESESCGTEQGTLEYSSSGSCSSSPVKCQKKDTADKKEATEDRTNKCQEDINRGRSRHRHREPILLCHSAPHQYDPVYKSDHISNAGFIQSVLYEMLYKKVFKMEDALDAADFMLHAEVDPIMGKPDVYDKEFEGTALQALDNHLIPFPYKVAKALDPEHYRNIEYDVWTCEKRGNSSSRSNSASSASRSKQRKSRSPSSNKGPNTIGNLQRGTPCVVRSPPYQDIYGYIQGLTADNKNVEVYVPLFEYCIYVARKCILPVQTLPQEFSTLRKSPTAQGTGNVKYSREPIASRVFYNRGLQRGTSSNVSYHYDEGYGSPTKSGEMNDFETFTRENMPSVLSPDTLLSPNRMQPRSFVAANPDIRLSPHHYSYPGCMVYPGCPVCYPTVPKLQSGQNPANVVVNLSTNINNLQSPLAQNLQSGTSINNSLQETRNNFESRINHVQNRNLLLAKNKDPEWLYKSDFRVPPPIANLQYISSATQPAMFNQTPIKLEVKNSSQYPNYEFKNHSAKPKDENNNENNEHSRRANSDITKITIQQSRETPSLNPYLASPYEVQTSRPYYESGNHFEEDMRGQPTTPNLVMGYPTNLLIDIPHSPAYPTSSIRVGDAENVTLSQGEAISHLESVQGKQDDTSIPPIYVPVPHTFFGPVLNSVVTSDPRIAISTEINPSKPPKNRIIPSLQNLQIDQNRICPSTPLATPSFPLSTNMQQSTEGGSVQIFQFPEPAHSIIPVRSTESSMPWTQTLSTQEVERHTQVYTDRTQGVYYYSPTKL